MTDSCRTETIDVTLIDTTIDVIVTQKTVTSTSGEEPTRSSRTREAKFRKTADATSETGSMMKRMMGRESLENG